MNIDKEYNLPENKEYIVSGTIEEIISILISDFGINKDEARFITYISTIHHFTTFEKK